MSIEEWRTAAAVAIAAGADDESARQSAAELIREVNFDLAYGGPLARLDEDGELLSDEEINELCRTFGYAEIAGDE